MWPTPVGIWTRPNLNPEQFVKSDFAFRVNSWGHLTENTKNSHHPCFKDGLLMGNLMSIYCDLLRKTWFTSKKPQKVNK